MKNFFFVAVFLVLSFSSFAEVFKGFDYVGRTCEISILKQSPDAMKVQIKFVDDRLGAMEKELVLLQDQNFEDRFSYLHMVDGDPVEFDASYIVGKSFRFSTYNAMTERLVSTECKKLRRAE